MGLAGSDSLAESHSYFCRARNRNSCVHRTACQTQGVMINSEIKTFASTPVIDLSAAGCVSDQIQTAKATGPTGNSTQNQSAGREYFEIGTYLPGIG